MLHPWKHNLIETSDFDQSKLAHTIFSTDQWSQQKPAKYSKCTVTSPYNYTGIDQQLEAFRW